MFRQYKYKFYLNANHSIMINGNQGQVHPHTWELAINIAQLNQDFQEFSNIEKCIEALLEPYQDKYLNEVAPFDRINPTLENICDFFKDVFEEELIRLDYILLTIEISETPTRSYILNLVD